MLCGGKIMEEKTYSVIHGYDVIGTARTMTEAQKICDTYVLENNVKARVLVSGAATKITDYKGVKRTIFCRIYAYRTQYLETFVILSPDVSMQDLAPLP